MPSDASRDPLDRQAASQTPGTTGRAADRGADARGPDGNLPRPDARRWYRRDKRRIVAAVRRGALGFREACLRYRLSYQEFVDWERASGADTPSWANRQDNERRRFHRVALRSPASLRTACRRIDCEIENLSATGALLMVGETRGYPSQITLEVPHSREALPGRIAWRGRNAIGIAFDAAPGAVAAQLDNRWIEGSTARGGDRR